MASAAPVTVLGANNQTVTLHYDTTQAQQIAATLAASITAGVLAGTTIPSDGGTVALGSGQTGELVANSPRQMYFMSPGYEDAVIGAGGLATVFGSGGNNESILKNNGALTFIATAGSGTVAAGGSVQILGQTYYYGSDIILPASDAGNWDVATGNGNDTIVAVGAGSDSIAAGGGTNNIQLGAGSDSIQTTGFDIIQAGPGSATVSAVQGGHDRIVAGSGNLDVNASGNAIVVMLAGTGSDTFNGAGGTGIAIIHGGTGGNNLLTAGTGPTTLFGGGSGDVLTAGGAHQILIAGAGAETLQGAATGYDRLRAGAGADSLGASGNYNVLIGGLGTATMNASGSHNEFLFINAGKTGGGSDTITGFNSTDKIAVYAYAPGEVVYAVNHQTPLAGGSTTVTLTDNTKITFTGLSAQLTAQNFTFL